MLGMSWGIWIVIFAAGWISILNFRIKTKATVEGERKRRHRVLARLLTEYSFLTDTQAKEIVEGGYGSYRWGDFVSVLHDLGVEEFPDVMKDIEEKNQFYEERYGVDIIFETSDGTNPRIRKKGAPGSRGYDFSHLFPSDPTPA